MPWGCGPEFAFRTSQSHIRVQKLGRSRCCDTPTRPQGTSDTLPLSHPASALGGVPSAPGPRETLRAQALHRAQQVSLLETWFPGPWTPILCPLKQSLGPTDRPGLRPTAQGPGCPSRACDGRGRSLRHLPPECGLGSLPSTALLLARPDGANPKPARLRVLGRQSHTTPGNSRPLRSWTTGAFVKCN